jgi:NAD(P)-dependent dehydrogenase (short-subunit alcohol dehydrogenase family)
LSRCEYPHVVVTGASSGTGRAVALRLAASRYHVYAGVRAYADGITLYQHTPPGAGMITPMLLDVSRPAQVAAAARAVTSHAGQPGQPGPAGLAGLVNYADSPVSAQLAVTQAFVPLLRQAQARIVMIGSGGAGAAPESALAALCEALRQELAPWNIHIVLIEPSDSLPEAAARAVTRALTLSWREIIGRCPPARLKEGSYP